jgi:hypothetical protein
LKTCELLPDHCEISCCWEEDPTVDGVSSHVRVRLFA